MEERGSSRSFWTFIVTDRRVGVRGEEPNIQMVLMVEGHFIYCVHRIVNKVEEIIPVHLTPPDRPVQLEIPPWFFKNQTVEEINARDITSKLVELVNKSFELVPPPQVDVPWHQIPPSKRRHMRRSKERQSRKEFESSSPEV